MKHKKKKYVYTGILVVMILFGLFLSSNTKLGYMMTIRLHGYTEIKANVYLDKNYSGDYQVIQELLEEATERVTNFWGTLESKPVIILSESNDKLKRLGYSASPFTSMYLFHGARTYMIFSTNDMDVDLLAHEMTHAELYGRAYKDKWYNSSLIPIWFNEGVAMQNDYRDKYNDSAWEKVTNNGTIVKSLNAIASIQNFYTDDSKVNYIISRHELHDWISKNGMAALIDLIQRVNKGEEFHELYDSYLGA